MTSVIKELAMPERPYEITKELWEEFEGFRKSSTKHYWEHPKVCWFIQYDAHAKAHIHFVWLGHTHPIVIE